MNSSTLTSITFHKTLRVVHETQVECSLKYEDFCENFVDQLDGEDGEAYRVRSKQIWLKLLAKRTKPEGNAPFIDLGEEEDEADWDDGLWDGGGEDCPAEECEEDIRGLIEFVQKDDKAFKKDQAMKRQKRAEDLVRELEQAKVRREAEAAAREAMLEKARKEQREREVKAMEERLAALRKEMERLQADLGGV